MYMFPFPKNSIGKYFCVRKPSIDLIFAYSAYAEAERVKENTAKMKEKYLKQMQYENGYILYNYEFKKLIKNKDTKNIVKKALSKRIDTLSFTNEEMEKFRKVISA